jgi:hypothetical protein
MINEYRNNFTDALMDHITNNDIKVGEIKYTYPRIVQPKNVVQLHIDGNRVVEQKFPSSHSFVFGEIPDFSFIVGKKINHIEVPIPPDINRLLEIIQEMSQFNLTYSLNESSYYGPSHETYSMGVRCNDIGFFEDFIREHKFKVLHFYGPNKQVFFHTIEDLKMTMFHMTLGKASVEFLTRRIDYD